MGKIILEFDAVEEQDDARTAIDGYKWKLAVCDIDQLLRNTTKRDNSIIGNENPSEEEYKIAEKLREEIRGILDNLGLIMD